jgi:hypothetical protein
MICRALIDQAKKLLVCATLTNVRNDYAASDWQPKSIRCPDQARFHPPHSENVKPRDRYSGANWRAVQRWGWRDGLPEATRWDGATFQGTYAPISFFDVAEVSTRNVYCIITGAKRP